MQTIKITADGLYERTPGMLWAKCYNADTDKPRDAWMRSSTSGCSQDYFKFVSTGFKLLNDHYMNAIDGIMSEFGASGEDTIFLNGKVIQKPTLAPAPKADPDTGAPLPNQDISSWIPEAFKDYIPAALKDSPGAAVIIILVVLYMVLRR